MEKVFTFPNKKVFIKPITRKGGWLPANHDGTFMFSSTIAKYPVPVNDVTNKIALNATSEEIAALEKAMSVPEGYLNPNKPDTENFWKIGGRGNRKKMPPMLRLSKDGLELDLSVPDKYMLYVIAKSNKDVIAPSWAERFEKASYKFAIVDLDEQVVENANKIDLTKDAWMAFGSLTNSTQKMKDALRLLILDKPLKLSKSTTESFMKEELEKQLEKDASRFISVVKDPDLSLKGTILDAIDQKHITKDGLKYYITGNPNSKMTFENLVTYLKDPENQDILLQIKDKVSV